MRVIKHLVRIARRNPRAIARSPVLRAIVSSGFWLKLKTVVMFVVKGGSYIAAIITILEFLLEKRDISTDEALKMAKEKGIEGWLNEVEDPHNFLERYVKQMPLKDERDREIILEALTHDLADVSARNSTANAPSAPIASAPLVKSAGSQMADADIIDANAPVSQRRGEAQLARTNVDAGAANAVTLVIDVEQRIRKFYRDYGMRIDQLIEDIRYFATPGVDAIVKQLFKKKPNLLA